MKLAAKYYQQFDADPALDVPGEGYGGWKRAEIEIAPEHTALVVMHAWDFGAPGEFPGWRRAVEFIPRAEAIGQSVFPPLLSAVRASPMRMFHVTGCGQYARSCPGYRRAVELAGPEPAPAEKIAADPTLERLRKFRQERAFVGSRNAEDVGRGFGRLDFPPQARPLDDEGVAENGHQLFALCKDAGVNHLVYVGFAINWCLLLSPGGMAEMHRRGFLCSTIRQAVTAVENKETARDEHGKQMALWRVAVAFGFVFDVDDVLAALGEGRRQRED